MSRILIIGAGGVGRVAAHKCAQRPEEFEEICLASRTIERCRRVAAELPRPILVRELNADDAGRVRRLIEEFRPDAVINVASPYQNLPIMQACAEAGVHYVDTSMSDRPDKVVYDYGDQWAFGEHFERKGVTGLLSLGFDPGVVNVFCAYARKHLFDQLEAVDIIDCNAGSHGLPFATNFDPETNIREILAPAFYYEEGQWKETPPLTLSREFEFPEVGRRRAYLMAHEELISLARFLPELRTARFWMTFTEEYLTHLQVLRNVGMTRIDPVDYEGVPVTPLRFLKKLLPDPAALGPRTKGKTSIACVFDGVKDGARRRAMIYNVCVHERCFQEVGSQAISYTTGAPAVLGARLILFGHWARPGVYNPEQLDPDPFMERLGEMGLPWGMEELDPSDPAQRTPAGEKAESETRTP